MLTFAADCPCEDTELRQLIITLYTKYGKVQTNQQRVGVGRFFDRFYRLSDDNGTHRQFLGLW